MLHPEEASHVKLEVEPRLQFNGARTESVLRLTKVRAGDVIDNASAVRLSAALQVELVPKIKSIYPELNLRVLSQDSVVRQAKGFR
jgi:hypothetical protein